MYSKFLRTIEKIAVSVIWVLCFSNLLQATYEEDLYEYGEAVRRNLKFHQYADGYDQGNYIGMFWMTPVHCWVESTEPIPSRLVYNHSKKGFSCLSCKKITALTSSQEWAAVLSKREIYRENLGTPARFHFFVGQCKERWKTEGVNVTELDIVLLRHYEEMVAEGHGSQIKYGSKPKPVCSRCRMREDEVPFSRVCLEQDHNCCLYLISNLYGSWDSKFRAFMDDKLVVTPDDLNLWDVRYLRFSRMARELDSGKSLREIRP